MELVVCTEEGTETSTSLVGLCPAFGCELYSVVRNGLVNVAVLYGGLVCAKIYNYMVTLEYV
jgi:hypothetical protein